MNKKIILLGIVFIIMLSFNVSGWEVGEDQTFSYTGNLQLFYAPTTGTYQFELWGAQGGSLPCGSSSCNGGRGAYTVAEVELNQGDLVRVYVGGQGSTSTSIGTSHGGWNGGGDGRGDADGGHIDTGGGGGGATDIRIGGTSLSNRVLVAAGGGGAIGSYNPNHGSWTHSWSGGFGGCETGGDGNGAIPTGPNDGGEGGTQSQGGYIDGDSYVRAGLGYGGTGNDGHSYPWFAGGGSGYYGGGGTRFNRDLAGGGGSSYFSDSLTSNEACSANQRSGNGLAKVTLLDKPEYFEVTLKDGHTNADLSGFSITVSGEGSFSTTGNKVTTTIEQPNTLTRTVTVAKSGYFTREYTNHNLNNDLAAQLHRLIESNIVAFSDGTEYIFGSWAEDDIFITLSCDDKGGIGCDITRYCIDESNSCTPNQEYSSTIEHTTEGTRYIRFHSRDDAGNWESVQSKTLRLEYGEEPIPPDNPCEQLSEPPGPDDPELFSCIAEVGEVSTFYFNQSLPDVPNLLTSRLLIVTQLDIDEKIDHDYVEEYEHDSLSDCHYNGKIQFKIESDQPNSQIRLYCYDGMDWDLFDTINNGGYIFTPGIKVRTYEPDYDAVGDNVLPVQPGEFELDISYEGFESKSISGTIDSLQSFVYNAYLNPIYTITVLREQTGMPFSFLDRTVVEFADPVYEYKIVYEPQLDANNYNCVGTWNSNFPCEDAYDGIYSTYGVAEDGQISHLEIDYVKPVDVEQESIWHIKRDFLSTREYNFSDWSSCWNAGATLNLRLTSDRTMNRVVVNCHDGSEWVQMDTFQNSGLIFGEEMRWAYLDEVEIIEEIESDELMSIAVKMFCEDGVIENTLTLEDNQLTGVNCPYDYWFIRADYSTESYYRTLMPDYDEQDVTIFMLDLNQDPIVQIVFLVDDYHGNYDKGKMILRKFVAGNLETVIEQYLDMEYKAVMWVEQNEVYQVYIVDNDGNEDYIGDLVSDQASTKVIDTMDLITHGGSSRVPNTITWDYSGDKQLGVVTVSINDGTAANLNSITWRIIEESTGAIIDEKTSTSKQTSLTISGLSKERSYTSELIIDTDLRSQPIREIRTVWTPTATVFEGWGQTVIDSDGREYNRTSEIIKLLIALIVPILFFIIFSHSTVDMGMTITLIFFTIFNSLNWYDFLRFGGSSLLFNSFIWGINIIFAIIVFISWHKKTMREE